jgi:amino acid adenylation domain-containing protein
MDYPRDKCVHQLIAEQALRTPQSIAAVCRDSGLTYAKLEVSANKVANYLRRRGVRTGDRVAICLDRSLEMLIGVLGILKSGAAYVPLDPGFPLERIAAVLEDAKPSVLLTHSEIASGMGELPTRTVCLDDLWSEILEENDSSPEIDMTSSDLAYVIFTSGSTGKPKGVEISHRAVVNMLWSMAKRPGLTSVDTLLAVTTLAFDIAALELYLPLCVGARVVIATPAETADGNKLLSLLTTFNATVMQATPTTWRLLIEAGWEGPTNLKILCGGEALPRDLADALLARSTNVWNMYGPTETTVWSAVSLVEPGSGPVTIGSPIANTEFYVLDKNSQPVPLDVPGELHIGGDGLARGYWNRPELTTEKFVPDPFRGQSGSRLYKTGDLVRYRPDGTLEFLGRMDTQVKVRGFRIETAEVEHVLMQYPGLKECIVVAREDTLGDKRLVAYFVANQPELASADLRRFLSTKLPSYMVPNLFVPLGGLPRTPNGKIDRRALPAPSALGTGRSRDVVKPRNSREQTISDVCAEVLNLKEFSIHDSLFDLGADSLQIFQIVARANDAGLTITPTQILMGRTIAAICEGIEKMDQTFERGAPPPLAAVSRDSYRRQRSQLELP